MKKLRIIRPHKKMKTRFTHILYIGALLAAPAFAQSPADSVKTEQKVQEDAFRHVLQKPRVSKRFANRTWMAHAFKPLHLPRPLLDYMDLHAIAIRCKRGRTE